MPNRPIIWSLHKIPGGGWSITGTIGTRVYSKVNKKLCKKMYVRDYLRLIEVLKQY